MAGKKNMDPGYTTELHIRLKVDEREQLQKKADEYGTTLSQAARRIIFRRIDDANAADPVLGEKEIQLRTLQNMQGAKTQFKKIAADINKFISGYEKSLSLVNQAGDPAVNTEQTIRLATTIISNQFKLQNGLNSVIRNFGGAEVHVAARPQANTRVGIELAEAEQRPEQVPEKKDASKETPVHKIESNNQIPLEFRTMLNSTFNGTMLSDVEVFTDGKYEKIRLQVKVEIYRNQQNLEYIIDCVDFSARYKNVIKHLTTGRSVLISGEMEFGARAYNGEMSRAIATVEVKTLTLI